MQKLRRLPFFDRRVVQVDSAGSEPSFEKLQLTCSGGGKFLWFGTDDGKIYCLHHNFVLRSFQAFDTAVEHLVEFSPDYLLAVGGTGSQAGVKVRVYHVSETDAGVAEQVREIKPFGKSTADRKISCCDATPVCLAMGLEDGTVLVWRGDLVNEKAYRPTVIREMNQSKVTSVKFLEQSNRVVLFVATADSVMSYLVLDKNSMGAKKHHMGVFQFDPASRLNDIRLLQEDIGNGAKPDCCAVFPTMAAFLVATPAAIFAYDADHGNLSALALDGDKTALTTFGNYFVAVTEEQAENPDVTGPPQMRQNVTVCLTLPAVRLIGFSGQFSEVAHIVVAMESIFVLSRGGANGQSVLFQLRAKPMAEQIEILMKKRMFEWAAEIAIRGGHPREGIAEIYRLHGDSLYEKRAFDSALSVYCKTVELSLPLEPSYVIQKFLDSNKIGLIAKYLQKLHEKGLAEKEHTALLLQCYTKLKDKEALQAFVRQEKWEYDANTAISTLEASGYPKLASDLALRSGCREEFVRIHLEHFEDTSKVVQFIRDLDAAAAVPVLMTHGRALARSKPDETMKIVKRICGLGEDAMPDAAPVCEPFLPLFVDDSERLTDFLREAITSKHLQPSWQSIFPLLLELLLRTHHTNSSRLLEQEMMQLMKEHCTSEAASTSALILCKTYEFDEGFVFICEKTGQFQYDDF